MTDEAFKELINLYLDGELSPKEEERLNTEINASPERSRQFHEANRLHDAMQMVLDPQALQPKDLEVPLPWLRILVGLGAAASLAVGALLVVPSFFGDDVENGSTVHLEEIQPSQVQHYVSIQQQKSQRCSLAAQLRLAGLMPELTPADRQLQPVSSSAVVRRRVIVMRELKLADWNAESVTVVEAPKAEDVSSFSRYIESGAAGATGSRLTGGFEATLVSF